MEITESTVYWITRMDSIHIFLSGLCIFFGILIVLSLIVFFAIFMICDDITYKKFGIFLRTFWISSALFIMFFFISVFIPTTKEMALIKVLPAISNSRFVSEELPKEAGEIYMLAKEALKEKLVGEKK